MTIHYDERAQCGEPTDFAEPPPDGPYCVLCDERETAAAPLVETPWGPMHAACAASEPVDEETENG
jgi:hypothetical protein